MSVNVNFNKREIYFYNMIDKFYRHCDTKNIIRMIDVVNGVSPISLRILDWFVTRYSNKNKILITVDGVVIDVHISYKAQLKSYKKKYFDPFKRREKFDYCFKEIGKSIHTTIGQLNFFRWAIENGIINYVENNYDVISKEMNISNKDDKKRKKEKTIDKTINKIINPVDHVDKQKNNIGINVSKKIENEHVKIILTFD
jgi:hypothetical protein